MKSLVKWINHSNATAERVDSIVKIFHSSYLYLSVFHFVLSIFCKKGNFFVYITFYFDKYVTKTTRHIGNHILFFSIMDLPKFGKMWNGLKLFKTWQWLQICWETWQFFLASNSVLKIFQYCKVATQVWLLLRLPNIQQVGY